MLRIQTLGGLQVDTGHPLSGAAAQPRRLAVLALLARAHRRGITRAKLLALLWPDADEEQGRRTLNQALYALRRDLGGEEVIRGGTDVRLDPEQVACDVWEFADALGSGDLERAVRCYEGPFMDGFRLPGAAEFERWTEEERAGLAHAFGEALEDLARSAAARGDAGGAVRWWRRLAAQDPLNARTAVALMEALASAGDVAGALQHARIYEALMAQDLELPADRAVVELAERLRAAPGAPVPPSRVPALRVVAPTPGAHAAIALGIIGRHGPRALAGPPIEDLMVTDLLRAGELSVMSRARFAELVATEGGTLAAARAGAATVLVEGSVYDAADGVRADLHCVAVANGRVEHALRIDAPDLHTLAERAAGELARTVRASVRLEPIAI